MRPSALVGVLISGIFIILLGAGCTGEQGAPPAVGADEWTVEAGTVARNRAATADLVPPLQQGAEFTVSGDTTYGSPVVVAGGKLFAEGDRKLHALSLVDGSELWQFPVSGSFLSPAVEGERVFIRAERGDEGRLIAVSSDDGRLLWEHQFAQVGSVRDNVGGHVTSPVVVDGRVFVGASRSLYAFDVEDGSVLWEFDLGDAVVTSASVADGTVYVADFQRLHAVDAATGQERWHFALDGLGIYFAPVVVGEQVVIAVNDTIYSLDRRDGTAEWVKGFSGVPVIPAGAVDEQVFVKSTLSLFALHAETGEELWEYRVADFVSLPVVAGEQLYVLTREGGDAQVRALSRSDGTELWQVRGDVFSNAAPIVAGGYVFVRTTDGRILGYYSTEE